MHKAVALSIGLLALMGWGVAQKLEADGLIREGRYNPILAPGKAKGLGILNHRSKNG